MPDPDKPNKDVWLKRIKDIVGDHDEDVFLVGHSLGVPAILRYLEQLSLGQKVGGVVLVSGVIKSLEEERYKILDNFFVGGFDFGYIAEKSKNFSVIHGDNDMVVPFSHAEELSQNLNCKLISIPNGQHLNGSAGFHELPEALEALKEMIK